jgi:pimeloyl-ACP methyl ester carboxylesterase
MNDLFQNKIYEYDGVAAAYSIHRTDKPYLILVHGYCCDRSVWHDVAQDLSDDFSIIIPDLFGYGDSAYSPRFSMKYVAGFIDALLEHESVEQVHYVGHSMGGYIGMEYLANYASRLTKMTMLNTHCFTDSTEKMTNREKTIGFLQKHGTQLYINEIYKSLFGKDFYEHHFDVIIAMKYRAKSYTVESLIASSRGMIDRLDHSNTLKESKIPIQFILGENDGLIPLRDFGVMCSFPDRAHIHIIPNMGHMGMLEQREVTTKHLMAFSSTAV